MKEIFGPRRLIREESGMMVKLAGWRRLESSVHASMILLALENVLRVPVKARRSRQSASSARSSSFSELRYCTHVLAICAWSMASGIEAVGKLPCKSAIGTAGVRGGILILTEKTLKRFLKCSLGNSSPEMHIYNLPRKIIWSSDLRSRPLVLRGSAESFKHTYQQ